MHPAALESVLSSSSIPNDIKALIKKLTEELRGKWERASKKEKARIVRSGVFLLEMLAEGVESEDGELRQACEEKIKGIPAGSSESLMGWSIDIMNQMLEREGRRKELESKRTPISSLINRDLVTVPNGMPYHSTIRQLSRENKFQKTDESPWPTARVQGKDSMTKILLRPEEASTLLPADQIERWVESMWAKQRSLSDLDADCLDILMTFWLEAARSPQDSAIADIDNLLEMRGLKKNLSTSAGRRGGYTKEQRVEMIASICRLIDIWIEFEGPVVKRKWKKPAVDVISSRAVIITDTKGQRRLDGAIDVDKIVFQPGRVFGAFMWREGRQTALLSAQALKYDPYRQAPEKRLTRYLAWQWKIRAEKCNYSQPFGVLTLLDEAGIEINRRRPARTKDRLDKALEQLLADRVIAHWQWDKQEWNEEEREWFDTWLGARVVIEPPDEIKDHYLKLERDRPPAPKALPGADIGERLAMERKARRIPQTVMAEMLGVTPAYVSNIERGNAKVSKTMRAKIEEWLKRNAQDASDSDTEKT